MNSVQPMRISRVVGNGIAWYFGNLGFVLPLSFMAVLPELVCYLIFFSGAAEGDNFATGVIVSGAVSALCGTWLFGFLIHAGVHAPGSGQNLPLAESVSHSLRIYFPLLLLTTLLSIAIGFGLVLLIVPGIIMITMFWVAAPVLVVERRGILESIRRSLEMTAGHRWKIFLIFVCEILVSLLVNLLLGIVFFIWSWLFADGSAADESSMFTAPFSPVMNSLGWVIPFGISASITVASYVELRGLTNADGKPGWR